ncbi:aminopeptidase, partial [Thermodesulfobacteriota bacterium]
VEDGFAREIRGGPEADRLVGMLDRHGEAARNIAELGVGTNDQAVITGQVLEDEKVMGTIHIALGNNITMGGTCDVSLHLDGVVRSPTLSVDGRVILDEGRFVEELQ